jgi:hypothetical protein
MTIIALSSASRDADISLADALFKFLTVLSVREEQIALNAGEYSAMFL